MSAQVYEGSCHCGAVRYRVSMPAPEQAMACNCSICSRVGSLLTFVPAHSFELLQGEEIVRDYQFGRKRIHHLFCGTCGVRSFGRGLGPDGAEMVAINLRCIEGLDADSLPVQRFDGASL